MNDKEILQEALKASGMKQIDLAELFAVNKSTVSTNLRRENMSVKVLAKYLSAMGYSVMVGKKDGDNFIPQWELENDKEE